MKKILLILVLLLPLKVIAAENSPASLYNNNTVFSGQYKVGEAYKVGKTNYVPKIDNNYTETGLATIYDGSNIPAFTANGEKFSSAAIAGGHKTLPLPAIVKITNLENNKTAFVRINDRGPFSEGKSIILTESAGKILGIDEFGLSQVKIEFDEKETTKMLLHPSHQKYKDKFASLNNIEKTKPAEAKPEKKVEKTEDKAVEIGKVSSPQTPSNNLFGDLNDEERFFSPNLEEKNRFFVQLGVFKDLDSVSGIVKKFHGFCNFEVTTKINDKLVLYRLRAGPFYQENEKEVLDNFIRLGFKDPIISK
jgi:rare lipoprotein A